MIKKKVEQKNSSTFFALYQKIYKYTDINIVKKCGGGGILKLSIKYRRQSLGNHVTQS